MGCYRICFREVGGTGGQKIDPELGRIIIARNAVSRSRSSSPLISEGRGSLLLDCEVTQCSFSQISFGAAVMTVKSALVLQYGYAHGYAP